ncbi:5715_t:CDS:2 [Paraglomus occultum]|uniref:5715_t:CDS:1 n=1 Tax=Paraglomus occultum TaxID=144539 RepID=A0A9N8VSS3_9GLOM|nr:5715_t:CDS:2 [Paraglomus occultum]
MPPKKNKSDKSKQKEKQKIVEDKTFGLKNKKKSAKVQQQIKQIENQVMQAGNRKAQKEADARKDAVAQKKAAEQKKKEELAELFKPVQTQKVPFGVDPKTVLCQFFKSGQCQKGDKCKFSHDLAVERKSAKIDLYTDSRTIGDKKIDTMDTWDQKKLEQVVKSKHGSQVTTDIVCKYFLEAIENQRYGWFWECPNGGKNCKYRHALPPGYVLVTKGQKKEEENAETITLEEFLETERHNLGPNLTPVTLETFTEWKKNRRSKQEAEEELKQQAKAAAYKAGKAQGMSGRDLFTFNPDLVNQADDYDDDDDVFDINKYKREQEGSDENKKSREEETYGKSRDVEVEETGTQFYDNEEGSSKQLDNNTIVTEEGRPQLGPNETLGGQEGFEGQFQ